jgi:pyridoxine/pyridoxamine 5'-phosphate oxidase
MNRIALLEFMRLHRLAVQATVSAVGAAQAAIIGVAITDQFEIVFDTIQTTCKAQNLRQNPHIALVIGGWMTGDERTVQYEGVADEPSGEELDQQRPPFPLCVQNGPIS